MDQKNGCAFYENGSWYHRTKVLNEDGTVKYSKKGGFKTKTAAEKSFKEYEKNFQSSLRKYQLAQNQDDSITLKNYLLYWFDEIFSKRIEPTTQMVSKFVLNSYILPFLDTDIKIKFVSVEYIDELLKKIAPISASAGNKSRELLNIALKDAVSAGYLNRNPVSASKTYPRKKANIFVLDKVQIKRLLNAAKYNEWYLEILLGIFCGLRKGEILGLKFGDFDLENHSVKISRQLSNNPLIDNKSNKLVDEYRQVEKAPKTNNSYRTLKVPQIIIDELEKRKGWVEYCKNSYLDQYEDHDYISCQKNGKPHSMASMNIALTKICKRNGLPPISVHSLRHIYSTILMEKGVPLVQISAALGHESIHTTFEYYCDVMNGDKEIIEFMNQSFVPDC